MCVRVCMCVHVDVCACVFSSKCVTKHTCVCDCTCINVVCVRVTERGNVHSLTNVLLMDDKRGGGRGGEGTEVKHAPLPTDS